jgi:hypothetical protein
MMGVVLLDLGRKWLDPLSVVFNILRGTSGGKFEKEPSEWRGRP